MIRFNDLCPQKVSKEITNNRNVMQINYTNDEVFLTLISPGYNQKSPIENAIFGFNDNHYNIKICKYENDYTLEFKPKLINLPINVKIYPINDCHFKIDYSRFFKVLQQEKMKVNTDLNLSFDSKIQEVNFDTSLYMQTQFINSTLSLCIKKGAGKSSLIRTGLVLGYPIFNIGFSFLPNKITNKESYKASARLSYHPLELAAKYKNNNFKTFLNFQKGPINLDLAFEKKQEKYGYAQLSYTQNSKSYKLIVDSEKKLKAQIGFPIATKTSVDFAVAVPSLKENPIISLSLNFKE